MTASPHLRDLEFVDLYLGVDYADIKSLPGSNATRSPVPEHCQAEVAQVRAICSKMQDATGEPEFAIDFDDVLYRVTMMLDLRGEPVYFLRRMAASIRPLNGLGFPESLRNAVMGQKISGLVLIAGDMAAGKTSTVASLLSARLHAYGGLGLAIEDPPETKLNGLHGPGRCIQIPASKRHGHYKEQLRRAMRTGVSTLLIGEIRCDATASEAIRHSINGLLVLSTVHAKDCIEALTRVIGYATPLIPNAGEVLSQGLLAVIHQSIERIPGGGVRMKYRSLQLDTPDELSIRTKIRQGNLGHLAQDIDNQARRQTWQPAPATAPA